MNCDQDFNLSLRCVNQVQALILQAFDQQVEQHQLYYHTRDHLVQVQQRSQLIFAAVAPFLQLDSVDRLKLLLDLCAIAHDMIQIFEEGAALHLTRKRSEGVSEAATIDRLLEILQTCDYFSSSELNTIRTAIAATVCTYDPQTEAIYQPALAQPDLPIVARILALADLGALGIDGIEMYNREGSLLFLEENIDVVPLILDASIYQLTVNDPALAENIRQRLLKRCRFQISFAKSRVANFESEVAAFPAAAVEALRQQVFQHLNSQTLQAIEATTPSQADTPLIELLHFFQFERYLQNSSLQ